MVDRPELVGRDREFEVLLGCLEALPTSSLVVVGGDPGVGKTSLLDAVGRAAVAADVQLLRCTGDELASRRPYGALADGGLLAAGRVPGLGDAPANLIDEIEGLRFDRPALLLIDDVQWVDPVSLDAVLRLAVELVGLGALVVIAHRNDAPAGLLPRVVARLEPLRPRYLTVEPLTDADAVRLAEQVVGRRVGPVVRASISKAGGNPFYVHSMLDGWRTDGLLHVGNDDIVDVSSDRPPATVTTALLERVRGLGGDGFGLLCAGSVLGRRFATREACELAGLDVPAGATAAVRAARAGLLVSHGAELSFRHALVREAVYDNIDPAERERLHRSALDRMVLAHRADGELVPHLLRVSMTVADVPLVARVAPSATPDAALTLLDRAIAVSADAPVRHGLLVARLDALGWAGEFRVVCAAAEQLLAERLAPDAAVAVKLARLRARFMLGEMAAALHEHRLTAAAPQPLRAVEHANIGRAAVVGHRDLRRARSEAGHALELADDPATLAIAHAVLAMVDCFEGRTDGARDHVRRCFEAVDHDPTPFGRSVGPHIMSAVVNVLSGNLDEATADLEQDEHAGWDVSSFIRIPYRHTLRGEIALTQGRLDAARVEYEAGLDAALERDFRAAQDLTRNGLDVLDLVELGRRSSTSARPRVDRHFMSHWALFADALELAWSPQPTRAIERLRALTDSDSGLHDRVAITLCGPLMARLASEHGASADLHALVAATEHTVASADDPLSDTTTLWIRAIADHDLRALQELAADNRAHQPLRAAMMLDDAARLAVGRQHPNPSQLAIQAVDAHRAIGANGMESALRKQLSPQLFTNAGVRPRRVRHGWGSLTAAEWRVVDQVAKGHSNAEIATTLIISRRTVDAHLSHIHSKLGTTNRLQLLKLAIEHQRAETPTS